MGAYIVRRLLLMLVTLIGMSILIFVMLRLVPGNITDIIFDSAGFVNPAAKKKIEKQLGLDQPIAVQYVTWISGLMRGDLGYAYVSEKPAIEEILPRIPVTAKLALLALVFSTLFGVPLGVLERGAAEHLARLRAAGDKSERPVAALVLAGAADPDGVRALVRLDPDLPEHTDSIWQELALLSIPAAAVGFRSSALVMRLTRSSMLEVLRQDYIRTARAKGASETAVNYDHALRNAVLPVVTIIGIEAAFLIGGLIVTETVFNIPGVARFLVEAIRWRDYPIVQNLVMFIAIIVVFVNFLIDMMYAVLDPRIKYEE